MRGTVHRTYLYSVKTKKFFLGCEEPRKIFLRVGPLGQVLTLYKRPVCCIDTQPAGLCFTTFELWEPGADPERGGLTMTLNDWKDVLLRQEVEALEDFGYTVERYGDREISRDEVFETIVEWNGGLASAGHIKRVIGRVYGVKL